MKLDSPVILNPPPYTDTAGKVVHPAPVTLTALDVAYTDHPLHKKVFAKINGIPQSIKLLEGEKYETAGDYTQEFIENKLKEYLGDNPSKILRSLFPKTLEEDPNGPGSILAGMFSMLGIKSSPTCSCRKHAIEMNERGSDWCEQNIDTITNWLKEESNKRKLPFVESLAKMVVSRAIQKSRKLKNEQTF